MASIITVQELRGYLGVDESQDGEIALLLDSATERINRATGIDWTQREDVGRYNEAVRTQVWISYYAVRDASKNTPFLQEYLTSLICSLQLSHGATAQ